MSLLESIKFKQEIDNAGYIYFGNTEIWEVCRTSKGLYTYCETENKYIIFNFTGNKITEDSFVDCVYGIMNETPFETDCYESACSHWKSMVETSVQDCLSEF